MPVHDIVSQILNSPIPNILKSDIEYLPLLRDLIHKKLHFTLLLNNKELPCSNCHAKAVHDIVSLISNFLYNMKYLPLLRDLSHKKTSLHFVVK